MLNIVQIIKSRIQLRFLFKKDIVITYTVGANLPWT